MDDHRARLIRCFAAVFPRLSPEEIVAAQPFDVPAWDSIANVTLLAVIEEEFALRVDVDELESLTSFAAILDYLAVRA